MRGLHHVLPWLSSLVRLMLGVALGITVVVSGYVWLNDPLVLDSMRAEAIGPTSIKLYVSGYKRHERCPGEWHLVLNGHEGPWLITEQRRTGIVPVGKMDEVPVVARLSKRVPPGTYTATVIIQYDCLIPFRHRASFELTVPSWSAEP